MNEWYVQEKIQNLSKSQQIEFLLEFKKNISIEQQQHFIRMEEMKNQEKKESNEYMLQLQWFDSL